MVHYTTVIRTGTQFAPCLEDFRQTVIDTPVNRSCRSVLKRRGGNVAGFGKETCYHFFRNTFVSLDAHKWVLIWEDPHRRLLFRLGVVLVYPGFVSCWCSQVSPPVGIPRFCLLLVYPGFVSCWYTQVLSPVGVPRFRLLLVYPGFVSCWYTQVSSPVGIPRFCLTLVYLGFVSCWYTQVLSHVGIPRFRLLLVYPGFVSCYDVPNARRPPSQCCCHVGTPCPPSVTSALHKAYGAQCE